MQCLYRQVLLYDFKTYSTMFQWIQKEPLSLKILVENWFPYRNR